MGLPSGCLTDYAESQLRAHFFRTASFTKPTVLAIALSSGIQNDTATGAAMWELGNVGAYARQTLNPLDTNWSADSTTAGLTYNNSAITFPVATTDWGWVSGIVLCDSATYGAGNALLYGSLNPAQNVSTSNQLVIPISGAVFGFD